MTNGGQGLERYQQEFVEFLAESGALAFGQFTLKSGRSSPYFINTAVFHNGKRCAQLGYFFAKKITATLGEGYDVVFGPAYKGIPLAVSTTLSLWKDFQINKPWAFDRKEEKTHGDKGFLVGHELKDNDRVILLDDVFTTGAAKEEAIQKIRGLAQVQFLGVFITIDRQEKTLSGKSAIADFTERYGIPVHAIVTVSEAFDYLRGRTVNGKVYVDEANYQALEEYQKLHG